MHLQTLYLILEETPSFFSFASTLFSPLSTHKILSLSTLCKNRISLDGQVFSICWGFFATCECLTHIIISIELKMAFLMKSINTIHFGIVSNAFRNLFFFLIGVYLIYNVLFSTVQHGESVIHIHIHYFLDSFPI